MHTRGRDHLGVGSFGRDNPAERSGGELRPRARGVESAALLGPQRRTIVAFIDADQDAQPAEVKLSPEHLDHLFSAAVGIGVMHFRMMVRIEAARDLLAATDWKIENVAASIGFYDAPHFSRVFRELTGLRPGRYRQQSSIHTTRA